MASLTDPAARCRPGGATRCGHRRPCPPGPQPQAIPLAILFEDADLLVLDKPAGLVVHPAPGNQDGTLVNALLAHCGDSLPGIGGERRPGIVHRLDKDTSGVMVVAKTEQAMASLADAFATATLERSYLALCWGVPSPSTGEIEGAIGRDPRDRKRMAVVARGGKAALTRYRVRRPGARRVSLVECRLATGRTHQIRVHLASAAIRSWATRCICGGFRPPPAGAEPLRGRCWTFRARRCTPPCLGSAIHGRAAAAVRDAAARRFRGFCALQSDPEDAFSSLSLTGPARSCMNSRIRCACRAPS